MDAATTAAVPYLRTRILDRRARLETAVNSGSAGYLRDLLAEIDAALERIDGGTYGLCETCHDAIEPDRLQVDPVARFCVDHLSEKEIHAHEQDLSLATRIQSRLLPPRGIALGHWDTHFRYEPAGPVGGDYLDVTPLENGRALFVAVGDVSGRGVAASLLMTHLSAIFRSLLSLDLPLAEVMSRANRLFCASTLTEQYATLVCGRTNGDGLELSNAGHCVPLLLRRQATERVDVAGVPLGLFCGVEYPVTRVNLAEGESLVLYSDGITDTEDAEGRDFGEDGLAHSLRRHFGGDAEAVAGGVAEDVRLFRGGGRTKDDLTLLVVRRHLPEAD